MENLKQKIERLQAEKQTQHRPELMNDAEYASWLESLSEVKSTKESSTKKSKKSK